MITQNIPEKRKPPDTKETYAQGLSTFYVCFPLCFVYDSPCVVFAPSPISICTLYVLVLNPKPHPSSIPTLSVRVCYPPPPAPSRFLVIPKMEFEARHPPRNGDLYSHWNDLGKAPLHHSFPSHRPTIPPPRDTSCQLFDSFTAL